MTFRLLADADFNRRILRGLRHRIPSLDILFAHGTIPRGLPDPDVLVLARNLGRILISHDTNTMAGHFYRFLADHDSPGLILVEHTYPIGLAINELELICSCSTPQECANRILYIPGL